MKKNIENNSEGLIAEVKEEPRANGLSQPKDVEKGDFNNFPISKKTIKKLKDAGIMHLFPVQYDTFTTVHSGKDCIVQARTGSGKTLAFALPILERLREQEDTICVRKGRPPIALCLAPTRELAVQIHKEFEKFKSRKMTVSCFYGGSPYWQQEEDMRNGIDVLVGTPGRILDFLEKGKLDSSGLKHVILDEADRMLDMGFQDSIDAILEKAYTADNQPQTLLFSATVPSWVKNTAKKYSKDMKQIDFIGSTINKSSTTVQHKAIKCSYHERPATLKDVMQVYSGKYGKIIIFTSTKAEANELALNSVLNMDSQVLHGDIQQKQREITLEGFRNGKFNCLIATDVAARGLDIPEIDLVIQTEPPKDIDSYIHRAGRTGRAGRSGVCIIFYKQGQEFGVQAVERKAGIKFSRIGAPQQADLIKSSADDAVRAIDEVKDGVIDYFIDSAQQLIESRGAEKALAAALAFISGTTEITSRSMLTSQTGYTTYICKQNWELRSTGLIWQTLKKHLDESVTNSFRGMRMCQDKKGCVFDVPDDKVKLVEAQWIEDKYATLEQLTELPELCEGTGDGGGRGGFGGRGGGFGGGRGGRGGGGRGGGFGGRNNNSWGNNDRNNNNNNNYNNRNNNSNGNGHYNNNNSDYNNRSNGFQNGGGKRPMNGNSNEPWAKKQKTW